MQDAFNKAWEIADQTGEQTLYESPDNIRTRLTIVGLIPKRCHGVEYIKVGEIKLLPDFIPKDFKMMLEPGQKVVVKASSMVHERRLQVWGFQEDNIGNCGGYLRPFRDQVEESDPTEVVVCPEPLIHTVVFLDMNGDHLKTQQIPHGEEARAPQTPQIAGKEFWKWDKEFEEVTEDMVIKAIYDDFTGPVFEVRFETSTHVHIATLKANMGAGIDVPPDPPIIPGHAFRRYEGEWREVFQDELVIAEYIDMCEEEEDDCCCCGSGQPVVVCCGGGGSGGGSAPVPTPTPEPEPFPPDEDPRDFNVMFSLDRSMSMDNGDPSRISVLKEVVHDAITAYEGVGEPAFRFVIWDAQATSAFDGNDRWLTADEARALVDAINTEGATDLQEAMETTMSSFDVGKDPNYNTGGTNTVFTVSDANSQDVDQSVKDGWKTWADSIDAATYGVFIHGKVAKEPGSVGFVSYQGRDGQPDITPVTVSDENPDAFKQAITGMVQADQAYIAAKYGV